MGITTEEQSDLGSKLTRHWTAKQVYEVQNKNEYEIIEGQTIHKGIYDFEVKSKDGLRSVSVEADVDEDMYYISYPKLGDDDLLMNLPECSTIGI
ncbi:MAG: hypothetical protein WAN47_11175 [Nitrosotalea sp.]